MVDRLKSGVTYVTENDRANDVLLLFLIFALVPICWCMGAEEIAGNVASGFTGAVSMYIKGKA